MEYVTHLREDGSYQPLKEHLEGTASFLRNLLLLLDRVLMPKEQPCCTISASTAPTAAPPA